MRQRYMGLAAAAAIALSFLGTVGCSTAPKSNDVFDVRNKAAEYARLGDGFLARGVWDQALKYYEQALEADQEVDYVEGVARSYVSMGRAWLAAGDPDRAEKDFATGLDYARMSGSGPAQALAMAGLGEVSYALGNKEEALSRFEQAQVLAAGDTAALAVSLHDAATVMASMGRGEEARAGLEKAASINAKAGRWSEVGANRYILASILSKAGKYEDAVKEALLALAADKKVENGPGIAKDLAAVATIKARMGKKDEAWDWWRRAFDTALAANMADAAKKSLQALISLAAELGKAEEGARYESLLARLEAATSAAPKPAAP